MNTNLSRRVQVLEDGTTKYKSIFDIPDEVLEALLALSCGGRTPTDDDLMRISFNTLMEQQNAKP